MVTSVDVYKEIRRLQLEGVTSQRAAARKLGISRNTVAKYWDGENVPWDRQSYKRAATVVTEEVARFINECLEDDAREGIRKQHHTARRIYSRLVDECGFTGSESSIRKIVHEIRAVRESKDVYVPLYFEPGVAMQVDWGEATIYQGDVQCVVNLFCARLCYSCTPFVVAYQRQNLESFLEALTLAMQYFGGVPRKVIFDNARVAVKSGFGAHAAAQDDYAQLAAHYGFEAVFCNPASGNEKGLVENLVGYIRRNVCVPLPRVISLEQLNAKLLEQCTKYLGHHIESKPATVGEMFAEEQKALRKIPKYALDISKKYYPVVGRYATVVVETNQYSVPCNYRGQTTTVKAFPQRIEIWINGTLAASHTRLYGKREESLDIAHYLPILAQKGRAIRFAKPVLKFVPAAFIDWMESQHLSAKEMIENLEACREIGYQAVMQRERVPAVKVSDPVIVQGVDLSQYDLLCTKGAALCSMLTKNKFACMRGN